MCEPYTEYDIYARKKDQAEIARQKATPCVQCPVCVSDTLDFGAAGSLQVGYCFEREVFMTGAEMAGRTMFDCYEGE